MAFDHLLNLSLAFHTRRKTGEVLRILDRGQAINHIFEVRRVIIRARRRAYCASELCDEI